MSKTGRIIRVVKTGSESCKSVSVTVPALETVEITSNQHRKPCKSGSDPVPGRAKGVTKR